MKKLRRHKKRMPADPNLEPTSEHRQLRMLLVACVLLVFLFGSAAVWYFVFSKTQADVQPLVPFTSTKKEVVKSKDTTTQVKESELPAGIPKSLPQEGVESVKENYVYTASTGEQQSVRQFVLNQKPMVAMQTYSDFFIAQGWYFDPSSVVNTDDVKLVIATKDKSILKISARSILGEPNKSSVEIVILNRK